jgi:hypothetical protein
MMEAVSYPETMANIYQTTWCYIPEDSHLDRQQFRKYEEKKVGLNCQYFRDIQKHHWKKGQAAAVVRQTFEKRCQIHNKYMCNFNHRNIFLTYHAHKLKLSHYTPWRCMGERRYSSYSYLTSALDGGEWSASRPGRALPPGKEPPVPIGQEAGWAPEPVWTQRLEEKSSASVGDRTPVVQSIVSHYTD